VESLRYLNMRPLVRPPTLSGVGPLEVFRAIAPVTQNLVQTPQRFVLSSNAHAGLVANPTAATAAALHAAQVPSVIKVWTELAFESVRASIVPDAPSRLSSVYATADVYEAFSFTEITNGAHYVHRGVVQDGVPWRLVDMGSFEIVHPPTADEAGFEEAWKVALDKANRYWLKDRIPASTPFFAEILVGGTVNLDPKPLRLLDVLEADGFISR